MSYTLKTVKVVKILCCACFSTTKKANSLIFFLTRDGEPQSKYRSFVVGERARKLRDIETMGNSVRETCVQQVQSVLVPSEGNQVRGGQVFSPRSHQPAGPWRKELLEIT